MERWIKVFKNGPIKISGRQPLKNLKWVKTISLQIFRRLFSTNFTWSILKYLDQDVVSRLNAPLLTPLQSLHYGFYKTRSSMFLFDFVENLYMFQFITSEIFPYFKKLIFRAKLLIFTKIYTGIFASVWCLTL